MSLFVFCFYISVILFLFEFCSRFFEHRSQSSNLCRTRPFFMFNKIINEKLEYIYIVMPQWDKQVGLDSSYMKSCIVALVINLQYFIVM